MNSKRLNMPLKQINGRRKFLKRCLVGSVGFGATGLGYSLFEAGWIRVLRKTIAVPRLPTAFQGMALALLADIHHGPYVSLRYVRQLVQITNSLRPDAIMLAGDYVHRDGKYIDPCFSALSELTTAAGEPDAKNVFGVLGNHDHWEGAAKSRAAMRASGIVELTNCGVWIERGGVRLRLAGVGDLWADDQNLAAALDDTGESETSILLCHNPDFVEGISDRRVGLVLSGHTHGGQVVLPIIGAPRVPSRYGQKYLHGLVKTPHTQVYVSRGCGTVTPPVRFCCRPEITLITIV